MSDTPSQSRPLSPDLKVLLDRMSDRRFELAYIKNSRSYRLTDRLRRSRASGLVRAIRGVDRGMVTVRALGREGAMGRGRHVWVLRVSHRPGEAGVPWNFIEGTGFALFPTIYGSHGACAQSEGGVLRVPTHADPELVFQGFPWGGLAEVEFGGRREVIDLSRPATTLITIRPALHPMVQSDAPVPADGAPRAPVEPPAHESNTPADEAFLRAVAEHKPAAVAIHCPRWLGISSATATLFDVCYRVPESAADHPGAMTDAQIDRHARVLAESGVGRFVISGGDPAHQRLVLKVRALRPDAVFDVVWHGSYLQFQDDYEWAAFRSWVEAARAGVVRGIATVKAGMEAYIRSLGVPSALLHNLVPGDPLPPPPVPTDALHAGVWISGASFRKSPQVMLAALGMLGNVRLHSAGMDERAREVARFMGLSMGVCHPHPLPQAALLEAIRRTHLTMYVTFSECCPMLPLESMRVGVPCLLGPVSHLFEDDAYLHDRLVVPYPDRAEVIARWARRAADERDSIMDAFSRYIPGYNRRARELAERFIREGPTPG
jgi:hypothetical protein